MRPDDAAKFEPVDSARFKGSEASGLSFPHTPVSAIVVSQDGATKIRFEVSPGLEPRRLKEAPLGEVPYPDFKTARTAMLELLSTSPSLATPDQLWQRALARDFAEKYTTELELLKRLHCSPDPSLAPAQQQNFSIYDHRFVDTGVKVTDNFSNLGSQALAAALYLHEYLKLTTVSPDKYGRFQAVADALLLFATKANEFVDRKALKMQKEQKHAMLIDKTLAQIPEERARILGHAKRLFDAGVISKDEADRVGQIGIHTSGSQNYALYVRIEPDGNIEFTRDLNNPLQDPFQLIRVFTDMTFSVGGRFGLTLPERKCWVTAGDRGDAIVGKVMRPLDPENGDLTPVSCYTEDIADGEEKKWLSIGAFQGVMTGAMLSALAAASYGRQLADYASSEPGEIRKLGTELLDRLIANLVRE